MGFYSGERGPLDIAGIVFCSLALAGLMVVGGYGATTAFIQSQTYLKANEWVALLTGVLGAGCGLYLAVEFTGRLNSRHVVSLCLLAGLFSIFAVTKGVPAAATLANGKAMTVRFTVTGHGMGGRNCRDKVFARNEGYEEFSICARALPRHVDAGDVLVISGKGSTWGIVQSELRVL